MKPPISKIIDACAKSRGISPKKVLLDKIGSGGVLDYAVFVCNKMGYGVPQICACLNLSDIDVRIAISRERIEYNALSQYRENVALVGRILDAAYFNIVTSDTNSNGKKVVWTEEDEIRIQRACVDAEIFMQQYGRGAASHPDGKGYYSR